MLNLKELNNMEKNKLTYKQVDRKLNTIIKKVKTLSEMKKRKVENLEKVSA